MMMRKRNRRSAGCCSAGRTGLILCVLFTLGGILYSQQYIVYDQDYHYVSRTMLDSIPSSLSSSSSSSKQIIPLDQYFDNMTLLHSKIQDNIHFHQRGGNLKLYQNFLDNAIDTTFQKYDISFVPKPDLANGGTTINNIADYLQQYYVNHTSTRRGYGEALPGRYTKANISPLLYERRWIDIIEPRELKLKWDVALGPIGPICTNLIQLGATNDAGDGGKSICMPQKQSIAPAVTTTETATETECHVISIGGNDNWVFETAMVHTMNCTTYTFDCTLPGGVPKNKPDNDQIKFFNYCISGGATISPPISIDTTTTNGNDNSNTLVDPKYLTYQEASQIAGITVAPMYFKIDVEGFEYDIFTNMLQTTPYDMLPMQIQVELHWNTRMTDLSWMLRNRKVGEILLLTNMMFSIGGYIPIEYDFNPYCPSCMEVLYFRAAMPATSMNIII